MVLNKDGIWAYEDLFTYIHIYNKERRERKEEEEKDRKDYWGESEISAVSKTSQD